jgi:hypothetical protein
VPAAAVVAVAVIGMWANNRSTRSANEHALALAREQHGTEEEAQRRRRIEERRVDAYCDLLIHINREVMTMTRTYPFIEVGTTPPPPPPTDDEADLALTARVTAFGSKQLDEVRAGWRDARNRFFRLAYAIRIMEEQGPTAVAERARLEAIRQEALGALERVEQHIRRELQEG